MLTFPILPCNIDKHSVERRLPLCVCVCFCSRVCVCVPPKHKAVVSQEEEVAWRTNVTKSGEKKQQAAYDIIPLVSSSVLPSPKAAHARVPLLRPLLLPSAFRTALNLLETDLTWPSVLTRCAMKSSAGHSPAGNGGGWC